MLNSLKSKEKTGQKLSKMRILCKILKYENMETNQIGRDTGIDKTSLCRIMQRGSCKVETADKLFEYLGLIIRKEKKGK